MKRDCPKRKKNLRDEKPSVRIVEGSNIFNGGDIFLVTAERPGMLD